MPEADRFYMLDGMRGTAAILVVLFHLGLVADQWAAGGYLAVDFFFALSGFVISSAYSADLLWGLPPRKFAVKRIIRLYPLYAVGLGIGLMIAAGAVAKQGSQAFTPIELFVSTAFSLFLLPTPLPMFSLFPLNGPGWSLFLELVVNIGFAVWMVRWRSETLVVVVGLSAIALAATAISAGTLNIGWDWDTLPGGYARVMFSFTVGVLLARHQNRIPKNASWLSIAPVTALVLALTIPVPPSLRVPADLAIALIICPGILYCGIRLEAPQPIRPIASFLGDISYPIYALHFPLIFIGVDVARKIGLGDDVLIPVVTTGLVVMSAVIYRLYDVPVRRYLSASTRLLASQR